MTGLCVDELVTLLEPMAATFDAHQSPIAHELASQLRKAVLPAQLRSPIQPPILIALDELGLSRSDPLTAGIMTLASRLHWRAPGFGRLPKAVGDKLAVVELLGPDGMIWHEDVRCGLLLQQSDHLYPKHQHAAEELYAVLHGGASWSVGEQPDMQISVGEFSHHLPRQSHGIATDSMPLLALWGWCGDISSASYSL